ncbi:MAG: DUF262 domain-containing protein [Bacteroidetes bacterium]|nr:DUF262 domain-containing protein [Bacteroidota bacterium]
MNTDSNSSTSTLELELESIESEDEDYSSSPPEYRIINYPADFTLEVLHQQWKSEEIIIPPFQRRFVWSKPQASKLIESFLLGLPVPGIFLYRERTTGKYLVIDGQQRLKSIFFYLEGKYFLETQVFRLRGLNKESRFYEKSFEELNETDQRNFKNSVLRASIIQQIDPEDSSSIYHIFERLNTGGTSLANQEIRNCIYHGKFVQFLENLNNFPDWRKILGKNNPDKRSKDIELILRFFAISDPSEYKMPMKDYLSMFMKSHRNASEEIMSAMKGRFENTCTNIVNALGEKPFHISAGMNSAVFDSVMNAFSGNSTKIPPDIKSRYDRLISDDGYKNCIKSSTTDERTVRTRLELASELLFSE